MLIENNDEIKDLMSLRTTSYDMMMSITQEPTKKVNISENWKLFRKGDMKNG